MNAILVALALAGGPQPDDALRQELLAMTQADQAARVAIIKAFADRGVDLTGGKPITDPAVVAAMTAENAKLAATDAAHRTRLKAIVSQCGWPGKSRVGADGEGAAWLVVQHADADPAFQDECLKLMAAAPPGEVEGKHLAYLTDRTLITRKRPQRYGTQMGANFEPLPIEDPKQVDALRAKLGLMPLAEYRLRAKAEYEKLSGKTPGKD